MAFHIALGRLVQGFVQEHDLSCALRTGEHLAPHCVVDPSLRLPVGMERLVHPPDLGLHLLQQPGGGIAECGDIERQVVVGGNERGGRRQVAEDHAPRSPFGSHPSLVSPLLFELESKRRRRRAAPLGRNAGHAGAAEAVQNDVAGLRVVKDGGDDGAVGHLGVVAVGAVEHVGLAGAHVHRKGLAVVRLRRVVSPAVVLYELGQERIGTGRVPGWVRQPQDVLVVALREVVTLAQLRQLLLQPFQEVAPPRFVRLEGQAEAFDRSPRFGGSGSRKEGGAVVLFSHVRFRPSSRLPCKYARCVLLGARASRPQVGRRPTMVQADKMPACRVFFGVSGETSRLS